jgi:hypothetical protein
MKSGRPSNDNPAYKHPNASREKGAYSAARQRNGRAVAVAYAKEGADVANAIFAKAATPANRPEVEIWQDVRRHSVRSADGAQRGDAVAQRRLSSVNRYSHQQRRRAVPQTAS